MKNKSKLHYHNGVTMSITDIELTVGEIINLINDQEIVLNSPQSLDKDNEEYILWKNTGIQPNLILLKQQDSPTMGLLIQDNLISTIIHSVKNSSHVSNSEGITKRYIKLKWITVATNDIHSVRTQLLENIK